MFNGQWNIWIWMNLTESVNLKDKIVHEIKFHCAWNHMLLKLLKLMWSENYKNQ